MWISETPKHLEKDIISSPLSKDLRVLANSVNFLRDIGIWASLWPLGPGMF
jgi:hypothetical protein